MRRIAAITFALMVALVWPLFAQGNGGYIGKTFAFAAYYDDTVNPGFQFKISKDRLQLDIPELDESKNEEGVYIQSKINEQYSLLTEDPFDFLVTPSAKYMILSKGDVCILVNARTNDSFWGFVTTSPTSIWFPEMRDALLLA
jgi:hypothetical protein